MSSSRIKVGSIVTPVDNDTDTKPWWRVTRIDNGFVEAVPRDRNHGEAALFTRNRMVYQVTNKTMPPGSWELIHEVNPIQEILDGEVVVVDHGQ